MDNTSTYANLRHTMSKFGELMIMFETKLETLQMETCEEAKIICQLKASALKNYCSVSHDSKSITPSWMVDLETQLRSLQIAIRVHSDLSK